MKIRLTNIFMVIASAAVITLSGCSLDVVNSDVINATNMWVEESDVTGATNGIYYLLREAFRQNKANQFYWGELRVGPAMWDRGTHRTLTDNVMNNTLHSNLTSANDCTDWSKIYTCIDQCNSVLKHAQEISMSDSGFAYCMGNAYFIRALCYYWLARIWGDVPLILTPTEGVTEELYSSRTDKSEVYAQIGEDIENALTYITDNSSGSYYATKDNINMLKADYALWMYGAQNGGSSYLTLAENALNTIGGTTLLDSFEDVFDVNNKQNDEIMFAIYCDQTNEQYSGSFYCFLWGSTQIKEEYRNVEGGVPVRDNQWFLYADTYIDEIKANKELGDQRTDVTYMERTGVSDMYETIEWPNKFTGDWSSGTLLYDDDYIFYRGAQYYMFLAELNYYKGDYSAALNNLNIVCKRAYGVDNFYTSATKDDVLEAIAKENRYEFAEEGNIWFTYIRLGYIDGYCPYQYWTNTGVQGGVGGSTNPNIYLFPVSSSALNKNTNLRQTEGWS